jgi:hypothetical protein
MDILDRLSEDYQRFPFDQTYDLYAQDVSFQDPLNQFRGLKRYQQMIKFIQVWFANPKLDLHQIHCQGGDRIETRWTLSWNSPLPWRPRIVISGWSELQLNPEGLICSHIDYWHCSRLDVFKQHFGFHSQKR